jgi:hypothetical protein
VLVCGSRDWADINAIRMRLVTLPPSTEIIHGAAPGADRIAGWLAEDFGFAVDPHPADWEVGPQTRAEDIRARPDGSTYDSAAGRRRNLAMLDEKPDLVLAFQRNGSRGTQHTINEARRRGIPVEVIGP